MQKGRLAGFSACALGLLILGIGVPGSAQQKQQQKQPAPAENEIGGSTAAFESMSDQLKLTADQKAKVKAIVGGRTKQWTALASDKTMNGKQKVAKMQAINQAADQEIEKVLTPQQRQKFRSIMEQGKPQSPKK